MIVIDGLATKITARACPFCGGHNIFVSSREHFEDMVQRHGYSPMIETGCGDCGCVVHDFEEGTDYDERARFAISVWNARAVGEKYDGRYVK